MKTKAQILKAIRSTTAKIAKERDKLRDLIDEAEEIYSSVEDAVDGLEVACDRLSEYL